MMSVFVTALLVFCMTLQSSQATEYNMSANTLYYVDGYGGLWLRENGRSGDNLTYLAAKAAYEEENETCTTTRETHYNLCLDCMLEFCVEKSENCSASSGSSGDITFWEGIGLLAEHYVLDPVEDFFVDDVGGFFVDDIGGGLEVAWDATEDFFVDTIGGGLETALDATIDFGENALDEIVDFGEEIGDFGEDVVNEIADFGELAIDEIEDFAVDAFDEVVDFGSDAIDTIGGGIVDTANDVADWFESLGRKRKRRSVEAAVDAYFGSDAIDTWEGIVDFGEEIVDLGEGVVNEIGDFGENAVDEIEDFAVDAFDEVVDFGSDALDTLGGGIVDTANAAAEWIESLGRKRKRRSATAEPECTDFSRAEDATDDEYNTQVVTACSYYTDTSFCADCDYSIATRCPDLEDLYYAYVDAYNDYSRWYAYGDYTGGWIVDYVTYESGSCSSSGDVWSCTDMVAGVTLFGETQTITLSDSYAINTAAGVEAIGEAVAEEALNNANAAK